MGTPRVGSLTGSFILVDGFLNLSAGRFRRKAADNHAILRLEKGVYQFLREGLVSRKIEFHFTLKPLCHLRGNRVTLRRQNPSHRARLTKLCNVALRYFRRGDK